MASFGHTHLFVLQVPFSIRNRKNSF